MKIDQLELVNFKEFKKNNISEYTKLSSIQTKVLTTINNNTKKSFQLIK